MAEFNSAVILAGGKSTRMGFDKQHLQVQGESLVKRLVDQLRTRFPEILVSSSTPQLYDAKQVRVIGDLYPGVGPLGGIHAALAHSQSSWLFVTACDMPYLELAYIDFMMQQLDGKRYDACATVRQGRIEPFPSFFNRTCLPILGQELDRGHYSVTHFLRKVDTLLIPEEIAASYLPGWRVFLNLNTKEEYERFRRGELHGTGENL